MGDLANATKALNAHRFGVTTAGGNIANVNNPEYSRQRVILDNDDFLGQHLENDPLWQLESHLTHDFTRDFYGSLDLLYRRGFQSKINGVEVGSELEIGNLGLTLNYNVTDNFSIRAGFSSNVFGDSGLDNSVVRLQLVYGWHRLMQNMKKLEGH